MLIFIKEVKHSIRNHKGLVMMIVFPLVLMLILGTALSGTFNKAVFIDTRVLYLDSNQPQTTTSFRESLKAGEKLGILFSEVSSLKQGIAGIHKGKYVCFVYNGPKGPELYKNERQIFRANLVEIVLTTLIQRRNALDAIARINPAAAAEIVREKGETVYINEISLNGQRKPGAMDYYAVTMLTMIIMYASLNGCNSIKRETWSHTANRLLSSPVKNYQILMGKILGTIFITSLQVLAVIAVSIYLFKACWGNNPVIIIILLLAEVIMAVSIGIGLAFLIRNPITVNNLLNMGIPLFTFLGGGYFQVEVFDRKFMDFSNFSPLRWMNNAIFQVIYTNDSTAVMPAILVNLGIAALFITVASYFTRKEAFLK